MVDGVTGFVVSPRDHHLVSSRMKELLGNPDLRHQMGDRARSRVLGKFTLEESAKTLLAEIE